MDSLSVTLTPSSEDEPQKSRKPAQRAVTKTVAVPKPAPRAQQGVGLIVLLALAGGAVYLLANGDSVGLQVAGAVVFVLAAFVLIVWAAASLGTGLGPKQLLEILKEILGVIRSANKKGE